MTKKILLIGFALLIVLAACDKEDDNDSNNQNPANGYIMGIITHFAGLDFSAGDTTTNHELADGEIIAWMPGGSWQSGPTQLWYRNDQVDTVNYLNQTWDLGPIDITTVLNVPTTHVDTVPNIPALQVGHVVVAKCKDGYAKFEVLALDTVDWAANVKFLYSPNTTFSE